jgi:hypothetical protein
LLSVRRLAEAPPYPNPPPPSTPQDLGEGVLYFNGTAGNGVQAQDHVTELKGDADMRAFIDAQGEQV